MMRIEISNDLRAYSVFLNDSKMMTTTKQMLRNKGSGINKSYVIIKGTCLQSAGTETGKLDCKRSTSSGSWFQTTTFL